MVHVALRGFWRQGVKLLFQLEHVQGGDAKNLRFATLEDGRTVGARNIANLSGEATNIRDATAVNTNLVAKYPLANLLLRDRAQSRTDFFFAANKCLSKFGNDLRLCGIECGFPFLLASDGESGRNICANSCIDGVECVLCVVCKNREIASGLCRNLGKL